MLYYFPFRCMDIWFEQGEMGAMHVAEQELK